MSTVKIKEFVAIAKELYAELESKLKGVPSEVWGSWVSTIFINQYGEAASKPASLAPSSGGVKTVTGTLEEITKQDKGEYTRYAVKINGQSYSTCDGKALGGKKFKEGDEVVTNVKQSAKNPQYWDFNDDNAQGKETIPF